MANKNSWFCACLIGIVVRSSCLMALLFWSFSNKTLKLFNVGVNIANLKHKKAVCVRKLYCVSRSIVVMGPGEGGANKTPIHHGGHQRILNWHGSLETLPAHLITSHYTHITTWNPISVIGSILVVVKTWKKNLCLLLALLYMNFFNPNALENHIKL